MDPRVRNPSSYSASSVNNHFKTHEVNPRFGRIHQARSSVNWIPVVFTYRYTDLRCEWTADHFRSLVVWVVFRGLLFLCLFLQWMTLSHTGFMLPQTFLLTWLSSLTVNITQNNIPYRLLYYYYICQFHENNFY